MIGEKEMKKRIRKKMSVAHVLSLGYILTILIGTLILMTPIASKTGMRTSFIDSLFTATSATCVTGLIPFPTFEHWTIFGQIIIIILIQIGGLGFMTIITLILMLFKKNIGLYNRTILMQSAGSYTISGVTVLIKRILIGTLLFETLGAIVLTSCFWKDMGPKAIYYGIFHSISAFCNAGFDLFLSTNGSLTEYYNQPIVLITIMTLITIGGLGFIVWSDIIDNRFRFQNYQLHTKIVLIWNAMLILIPAILFFIFEFTMLGQDGQYCDYTLSQKIVNSFFLSVSPRTAGFNSINLNELTSSGFFLTIVLMFIGGNSGSTAGGLKVTTFVVVVMNLLASVQGKEDCVMFKRKIPNTIIKQASSLFLAYLSLIIFATLCISSIENFTIQDILFEVISALGTVGLSIGISSNACLATKIILIFLMYAGRIGALTLFDALIKNQKDLVLKKPEGKIMVG